MKKLICLMAVLSLSACSSENSSNSSGSDDHGTFKATMGGNKIDVAVKCFNFDTDMFDKEFTFVSDGLGNTDKDGDGIIVRGDKISISEPIKMEGISLTIILDGVDYRAISTAFGEYKKTEEGVTGSTNLYKSGKLEGGFKTVIYKVSCK